MEPLKIVIIQLFMSKHPVIKLLKLKLASFDIDIVAFKNADCKFFN